MLRGYLILPFAAFLYFTGMTNRSSELPGIDNPTLCESSVICPGEDLVYEVSWMSVYLGTVHFKTSPPQTVKGKVQYAASVNINSYEGLPVADVHVINLTQMNEGFWSQWFMGMEKKDDHWKSETSYFDVPNRKLILERVQRADKNSPPLGPAKYDTLSLPDGPIHDGLSIFYFARANVHKNTDMRVPTIIYGKQGATVFKFRNTTEYEEIQAFNDRKIRVIPMEGKAEFEGLMGLTGEFKGWFTDDAAAVPVKAELKVAIGSVKLELISWKRSGWTPPQ